MRAVRPVRVRGVQTQAPSSPSAPTRPRCPTSPIRPRRPRSEASEPKLRAVRPHRPVRAVRPVRSVRAAQTRPHTERSGRPRRLISGACLRSPSEASEAPFITQSFDAHTKSEASEFALSDQSVLNGLSARSVQSDLSELSDQSDLSVLHGPAIRPIRPICPSGPLWRADFCPRHGKKRTNRPRSFPFNGEGI